MTADPDVAPKAEALADAVEATLPGWVERSVERRLVGWSGGADPAAMTEARAAGEAARQEVGAAVRALLDQDIDEQRTNPLALLRAAVDYPAGVLRRAGVPPVQRDEFSETRFPDDVYDLTPASFADIDPSLQDPGLAWGAAKAWAHRRRHDPPSPPPPSSQERTP